MKARIGDLSMLALRYTTACGKPTSNAALTLCGRLDCRVCYGGK